MQNTTGKVSLSRRNNITSVNSVVYAKKWEWPRKEPKKFARGDTQNLLEETEKSNPIIVHNNNS